MRNVFKILMAGFIAVKGLSASNPVCGGGCSGCAEVLPAVRKISKDIRSRYRTFDKKTASKYKKQVLEFMKAVTLIEKQIAKETAEIQVLEKEILKTEEGIAFEVKKIKELESTRSLVTTN